MDALIQLFLSFLFIYISFIFGALVVREFLEVDTQIAARRRILLLEFAESLTL